MKTYTDRVVESVSSDGSMIVSHTHQLRWFLDGKEVGMTLEVGDNNVSFRINKWMKHGVANLYRARNNAF